MVALSSVDGRVVWGTAVEGSCCGEATVANDVVFGAGFAGMVRGCDATSGDEV